MDSQRTEIQKQSPRVELKYPEWRGEKVEFDSVELEPSAIVAPDTEDPSQVDQPVLFARKKHPQWADTDLRRLM